MRIEALIEEKKADIIKKWFQHLAATYPPDTANFLKTQKDPFANPVGASLLSGLTGLVDFLLSDKNPDVISDFLDPIIRIRAVQTMFSPSQAVAFIFDLKKIIRDTLSKELKNSDTKEQLWAFESRIDDLALAGFDLFSACREKLYELRANTEKNRVYSAFKRAGLITEIQ
jgi:hypothetical protein